MPDLSHQKRDDNEIRQYLLLASVGPVQEFIASARRCRDLWFGSWLLSELSRAAVLGMIDRLEEFEKPNSEDDSLRWLVFPGALNRASLQNPDASVANRLLLRFQGNREKTTAVAEVGKTALFRRLEEIRNAAFERVGKDDPDRDRHFHESVAIQQVDDLIEYQWVAVAEDNTEMGYPEALEEAERLLAARKNTHGWSQPPWAKADVPKSSLDGIRESVLDETLFDDIRDQEGGQSSLSPEKRRIAYGIHGSERLCGVGLLKRKGIRLDAAGREIERFMSSSHLAALPLMTGIESDGETEEQNREAFNTLLNPLGEEIVRNEFRLGHLKHGGIFSRIDGAILFEGRLERILRDYGTETPIMDRLKELRRFLKKAGRGEPIPYYGILLADGDRMGAVIKAQNNVNQHRDLSVALETFARNAQSIVEEHDGSLVYSGGDDVLALLPLHTALDCAEELSRAFNDKMKNWTDLEGHSPTLSAGLAIVHHLMPLGDALDVAREAESIAKNDAGRDALAIVLHKRGGTPLQIKGHWESLVPRLRRLIRMYRKDQLSTRAGHELAHLERLSRGLIGSDNEEMAEIQRIEVTRILGRKRAEHGTAEVSQGVRKDLDEIVRSHGMTPQDLGKEMVAAAFLAHIEEQAGLEAKA